METERHSSMMIRARTKRRPAKVGTSQQVMPVPHHRVGGVIDLRLFADRKLPLTGTSGTRYQEL
jgi:hypothetical protein